MKKKPHGLPVWAEGRPSDSEKSRFAVGCPSCGDRGTRCIDTRPLEGGRVRRTRACLKCGHRFSTMEVLAKDLSDAAQMDELATLATTLPSVKYALVCQLITALAEEKT